MKEGRFYEVQVVLNHNATYLYAKRTVICSVFNLLIGLFLNELGD